MQAARVASEASAAGRSLSSLPLGLRHAWLGELYSRRGFRLALLTVGVASAPLIIVLVVRNDGLGTLETRHFFSLLVSWSFVGAGFVAWERHPEYRTGPLLMVLGLWWTAGRYMESPVTSSALLITIGFVWLLVWIFGFVCLLLSFPHGRLSALADRVLASAVLVVALPMQVLWLLFYGDPQNAFLVWPSSSTADAIDTSQRLIFFAVALAMLTVLGRRWAGASIPLRRMLVPVLAGALALVVFSVYVAIQKFWPVVPAYVLSAVFAAYAAVPLALLGSLVRARLARSGVADLLIELRANPVGADLIHALADALRDPSLEIAYWVPSSDRYVDADGRRVELPLTDPKRATTLVERGGETIAALVHDPALREERGLVDSVCAAAALALQNERLQVELRARLEELRASRARIVEATDAERRRIERNLHDGTQQRLVSIAMELGLAESKLPADASDAGPIIASARRDLLAALDELRELSRGIHPGVLTERGLKRALKELAYRTPIPLDLDVRVEKRLSEQVEVAAYFVVSEALANVAKHAGATAATVRVERRGERAVIDVADDGIGGADANGSGLRGLADRVEALGGSLSLVSPSGVGTAVHVEIPCE
jgi:signal transduction histidine kinase